MQGRLSQAPVRSRSQPFDSTRSNPEIVATTDSVRVAYYRGGISKALFFHESDIPGPGPHRDKFLPGVMGSPDPMQIDGMGGARIVTSKAAIVRPSDRAYGC